MREHCHGGETRTQAQKGPSLSATVASGISRSSTFCACSRAIVSATWSAGSSLVTMKFSLACDESQRRSVFGLVGDRKRGRAGRHIWRARGNTYYHSTINNTITFVLAAPVKNRWRVRRSTRTSTWTTGRHIDNRRRYCTVSSAVPCVKNRIYGRTPN